LSGRKSKYRTGNTNPGVTEECLELGIAQSIPNKRVYRLAIQQHAEKKTRLVRDYTGHGIGRSMHEAPQIINYGRAGTKKKIAPAIVFLPYRADA